MGNEGNIKTTVTLQADLHWEFKKRAAELRLSDKDAITEALRDWILKGAGGSVGLDIATKRKTGGK